MDMARKLKAFEFSGSSAAKLFRFQPEQSFKLCGFLVWGAQGSIESLKIAGKEQVVMPRCLPLQDFESPFPSEKVRELIESSSLDAVLPDQLRLRFPCVRAGEPIELQVDGSLNYLIFWGLCDETQPGEPLLLCQCPSCADVLLQERRKEH